MTLRPSSCSPNGKLVPLVLLECTKGLPVELTIGPVKQDTVHGVLTQTMRALTNGRAKHKPGDP
jgi:hypothetical protein